MIGDQGGWGQLCKVMAALILRKLFTGKGPKTLQDKSANLRYTGLEIRDFSSYLCCPLSVALALREGPELLELRLAGEACEPAAWLWFVSLSVITSPF